MASAPVLLALILAGMALGYVINVVFKKLEKIELPILGNLLQFSLETFYFTAILCAPLSGNLILSLLILAIFLYALFGTYGQEQLKPLKPEDRVDSKWFPKFP